MTIRKRFFIALVSLVSVCFLLGFALIKSQNQAVADVNYQRISIDSVEGEEDVWNNTFPYDHLIDGKVETECSWGSWGLTDFYQAYMPVTLNLSEETIVDRVVITLPESLQNHTIAFTIEASLDNSKWVPVSLKENTDSKIMNNAVTVASRSERAIIADFDAVVAKYLKITAVVKDTNNDVAVCQVSEIEVFKSTTAAAPSEIAYAEKVNYTAEITKGALADGTVGLLNNGDKYFKTSNEKAMYMFIDKNETVEITFTLDKEVYPSHIRLFPHGYEVKNAIACRGNVVNEDALKRKFTANYVVSGSFDGVEYNEIGTFDDEYGYIFAQDILLDQTSKVKYIKLSATNPSDPINLDFLELEIFGFEEKTENPIKPLPKHTITFIVNGEAIDSQTIEEGQKVTAPIVPNKEGYLFVGWFDGNVKVNLNNKITKSMELTAKWRLDSYQKVDINSVVGEEDVWSATSPYDNLIDGKVETNCAWGSWGLADFYQAYIPVTLTLREETIVERVIITLPSDLQNHTIAFIIEASLDNGKWVPVSFIENTDSKIMNNAVTVASRSEYVLTADFDAVVAKYLKVTVVVKDTNDSSAISIVHEIEVFKSTTATAPNEIAYAEKVNYTAEITNGALADGNIGLLNNGDNYFKTDAEKALVIEGKNAEITFTLDKEVYPSHVRLFPHGYEVKNIKACTSNVINEDALKRKYTANYVVYGSFDGIDFNEIGTFDDEHGYIFAQDILLNQENKVKYIKLTATNTSEIHYLDFLEVEIFGFEQKAVYYNVSFNSNGGNYMPNSQIVKQNANVIEPANPTKSGYTFEGWYNGEVLFDFNSAVENDLTLIAKWNSIPYTITYNLDGGTASGNPATYNIESEDITLTNPTKDGYTFAGWMGTDLIQTTKTVVIPQGTTGDREYVAVWNAISYDVTYNLNGGFVSGNVNSYTIESEDITLINPTREGYSFAGWSGTGISGTAMTVTISKGSMGDRSYTATWVSNPKSITSTYSGQVTSGDKMDVNLITIELTKTDNSKIFIDANDVEYYLNENKIDLANYEMGIGLVGTAHITVKYLGLETIMDVVVIAKTYTITYDLLGGELVEENPLTYTEISSAITLVSPTKEGYDFAGWIGTDLNQATKVVVIEQGSTGNRTYTATWQAINYTITYNLDGGSVSVNPATYNIESEDITLTNPTKEGYDFAGWKGTDINGTAMTVTISKGSIGDRTYTATWTAISYSITYKLEGGSVSGNPTSYTIESETIILANPTKEGYTFAGWIGTDLSQATKRVVITQGSIGDRTYTATWTAISYSITYNLNGGFASGNLETYTIENEEITLTNPTKDGYIFAGWSGTEISGTATNVTIAQGSMGNREYTATWTAISYAISYNLNGGMVEGNLNAYTIESGNINLNNPTKEGYIFAGWSGTGISGTTMTVTIAQGSTGNREYTATWTARVYAITYNLNGGIVSGNYETYTTETEDITLINPTKEGYTFAGWSGTGISGKETNVTISKGSIGDRTYTATWTATVYEISYQLNGGKVSGNLETYTIESGKITLTNPTKEGYTFAGWSGTDINGTSTIVTIVQGSMGNRSYTATWTAISYTITYDLDGGVVSGNFEAYTIESEDITLINPTKEGCTFAGWIGTDLSQATKTVIIAQGSMGNRTYTATWSAISYEITYDLGGGKVSDNPSSYTVANGNITLNNPTRDGYDFAGWIGTDLSQATKVVIIEQGSMGNRSYTATWTATDYSISYNLADGVVSGNPESYTIENEDITLINPTKEGYTFIGWLGTDISGTAMNVTIPKGSMGDRTYTATWSINVYLITFDSNGGNETIPSQNIQHGGKVYEPQAPTREKYYFNYWSVDEEGNAPYDFTLAVTGGLHLVANWIDEEEEIFTVTFNADNGTNNREQKVVDGEKVACPTNPEKLGYSFSGWYNGQTKFDFESTITGDITLTAEWELVTYTITYNVNGGTVSGNPATYTVESEQIILANPIKTGYTFKGWLHKGSTQVTDMVVIPKGSSGNREYTATWEATIYTITYNLNSGSVNGNPETYTIESEQIILANPTKEGYTFIGWRGTGLTQTTINVSIAKGCYGHRTYEANWVATSYPIAYNLDGGSVIGNPNAYTIESEDITLINPTKEGYNFVGWLGTDLSGTATTVTIPKGSIGYRNYTATWEAITYSITYNLNGGSVSGNPNTYTIESEQIILENPVKSGYTFIGWSGDGLVQPTINVSIAKGCFGNREYNAHWVATVYSITYELDGGRVSENPETYTIESEDITLTNPTKEGYTFAGWIGTDVIGKATTVTIPQGSVGDRQYTATWTAISYTITYNLDGGNVVGNSNSYTIENGNINLNNPTKEGYIFAGWSGTGISGTAMTVTIPQGSTGDRTYTASWTAISYSITYNLNGGVVSGNPETYTIESEDITLINPTKEGYVFAGWIGTGINETAMTVTIPQGSTGDRTYTASWTALSYSITYNLDGGSVSANPETYTIESEDITLINPTKEGYAFAGWWGTGINDAAVTVTIEQSSTGDRSYTAKWEVISYTITYDLAGGNVSGNVVSYTIESEDITLINPTKEGYTFSGWTGTGISGTAMTVTIEQGSTGDRSYTAKWTLIVDDSDQSDGDNGVDGGENQDPIPPSEEGEESESDGCLSSINQVGYVAVIALMVGGILVLIKKRTKRN